MTWGLSPRIIPLTQTVSIQHVCATSHCKLMIENEKMFNCCNTQHKNCSHHNSMPVFILFCIIRKRMTERICLNIFHGTDGRLLSTFTKYSKGLLCALLSLLRLKLLNSASFSNIELLPNHYVGKSRSVVKELDFHSESGFSSFCHQYESAVATGVGKGILAKIASVHRKEFSSTLHPGTHVGALETTECTALKTVAYPEYCSVGVEMRDAEDETPKGLGNEEGCSHAQTTRGSAGAHRDLPSGVRGTVPAAKEVWHSLSVRNTSGGRKSNTITINCPVI